MLRRAATGALSALFLVATPSLAQDGATIPLHKRPDQSGFANLIAVSVGGGPAGDVLLDTGSTGLRIRAAAVGPDVRLTNAPVTYSYTSGNVLKGVIGYTKVSFPGAGSPGPTATAMSRRTGACSDSTRVASSSAACRSPSMPCAAASGSACRSKHPGASEHNEPCRSYLAPLAGRGRLSSVAKKVG
jgi:hypothetical protein